jgi:hypothetical protein
MTAPNTAAAAFVRAKRAFGPALKVKNNPHLKSKYADLDACLEAVDDALLENGLALLQETSECDNGVIVETVFLHESGESIRCGKLHVPAVKADPQGYGSALTYARRYSLMAACGIAPEDDDGNAAVRRPSAPAPEPEHKEPPPYYTAEDFAANEKTWGKLIADGRKTVDELKTFLESKGTKRLTSQQLAALTKYTPKA